MKRWLAVLLTLAASPLLARDALGMFDTWGAFRDEDPQRCFAIAQPVQASNGAWQPFASISFWPDEEVRGQLHIRLSRERHPNAKVRLHIGGRYWRLKAGKYDAWPLSPAHDAFIMTKLRAARSMSITSVDLRGNAFADAYALKGAASAMDSAALGCAEQG